MAIVKVTKIGNSAGVVLPTEVLARLRVERGDVLHITETADGFQLTPYDPEFAEQIEAGRAAMRKYRNALRELAK